PGGGRLRIARQRKIDPTQPSVLITGSPLATRVEALIPTPRRSASDSSIGRLFLCLSVHDRERRLRRHVVCLQAVKACHRLRFGTPERQSSGSQGRLADGALVSAPELEAT